MISNIIYMLLKENIFKKVCIEYFHIEIGNKIQVKKAGFEVFRFLGSFRCRQPYDKKAY